MKGNLRARTPLCYTPNQATRYGRCGRRTVASPAVEARDRRIGKGATFANVVGNARAPSGILQEGRLSP